MAGPLVSVSGVRGIIGESFTEELVRRWAGAFAAFVFARSEATKQSPGADEIAAPSPSAKGWAREDARIVLARDTRPSGAWALDLAARTLTHHGITPIMLGVVPTPTAQLAVPHHGAAGAMLITASHNPADWNGLKFLGPDGVFLSAGEVERLHQSVILSETKDLTSRDSSVASLPQNDRVTVDKGAVDRHLANILALPIDVAAIRRRRFRVVVDPVNGAGALAMPPLLRELGCDVTVINGEPNGEFAHPPEPTPANLTQLGEAVRVQGADLGVAVDPDADRLVLVDETGAVLSEEYTVTLAVLSALSAVVASEAPAPHGVRGKAMQSRGQYDEIASSPVAPRKDAVVVANLSTTRMVDDVAHLHGARVVRTPVGERHVVEGMRAHGALIGGEGNGGVIYPPSHEGRDSLVGVALVLDLLARAAANLPGLRVGTWKVGKPSLSGFVAALPRYVIRKEKLPLGDPRHLPKLTEELRKLAESVPGASVSTLDGVRIDVADAWVHLRPSNTEPIIRLIGEAPTEEVLARLFLQVQEAMSVTVP